MPFWLRITLFALGMIVLAAGTSIYVYRRGSTVLSLGKRGRWALGAVLVLAPLGVIASRALGSLLPSGAAYAAGAFGNTLLLGVWISTVLLWAVDLPFLVINRFRRKKVAAPVQAPGDTDSAGDTDPAGDTVFSAGPTLPAVSRRAAVQKVATGAALSVGFGSAFYGSLFGRRDYEINEVPIPIPGLSPHLDGYRITQLSDIHFGLYVGEPELRSAVSLVCDTRPDLVVLTGDLLDHDPAYAPQLGRLVRALEQLGARDGVAMIPGNHDYYAGVDEVIGVVDAAGGRVLRNSGRLIGDAGGAFGLVGVDDIWSTRNGYGPGADLDRALAMVPEHVPKVLLCHNPQFFPEAHGRVALQLSGHTHGGQVNLGLHPADYILPYVHGLYEEEGTRLYVNRGFGTAGPPARVQAPPEVTVVILTAA